MYQMMHIADQLFHFEQQATTIIQKRGMANPHAFTQVLWPYGVTDRVPLWLIEADAILCQLERSATS